MITLFDYWRSSASYRVRIALGLAGLNWESVSIDLLEKDHKTPNHLIRNPLGLVPVLDIDGQRFTQSLAILDYLNETRNLGLLPDDVAERAHVRALAQVIALDIHPVCNVSVARYAVANSAGNISMESWNTNFIGPRLNAMEEMLTHEGKYCFGDNVSLPDICLVPQLYNARRWKVDLSLMPNLVRIEKALQTIPAFAAAHPDMTPH